MSKPTIQDFRIARTRFDDTVQDVADRFEVSRDYIYKCLKYPNMNRELHKKIAEYISEGISYGKSKQSA